MVSGGEAKCGHYSSHSLGIIIKFVKIPYLLTRKKVEGSLSKLCVCRKDDQMFVM